MTTEPVWLRDDVVLAIHRRQLAEHGGSAGIRDEGLLASALAKPKNVLAYAEEPPDLAALAASYAFGLIRNHPFLDGNKRTGVTAAGLFLIRNGYHLRVDSDNLVEMTMRVAQSQIEVPELASWLERNSEPLP